MKNNVENIYKSRWIIFNTVIVYLESGQRFEWTKVWTDKGFNGQRFQQTKVPSDKGSNGQTYQWTKFRTD